MVEKRVRVEKALDHSYPGRNRHPLIFARLIP